MGTEKEYGVIYVQCKDKNFKEVFEEVYKGEDYDKKIYIQVCPNDSLMVQASLVDKDLMDAIDIWRGKGYDPQLSTGKPGGCPPGGCQ